MIDFLPKNFELMSEDNDDKTFRISPKAGIPYSDLNIPDEPPLSKVETTAEILELSGILLENIKGFRILDNPVPPPKNTKEFIFFKII